MRIYFHLKDSHEVLHDHEGIEVSGPEEARLQALLTIQEELQDSARNYSGWSLVAADAAGTVLFTLDLDKPV